jgi:hypothetical protein
MKSVFLAAIFLVLACSSVSASFDLKLFVQGKFRAKTQAGITFKDCGKLNVHSV